MPKERGILQLFNMPRPGPQTRSPEEAPELRSSLCPFGLCYVRLVWPKFGPPLLIGGIEQLQRITCKRNRTIQ